MTTSRRTRLAPSPTGALHLGNAFSFLVNWALARRNSWSIVLRIDDLDSPRVKKGAAAQAIQDLEWLGIDWDEGPIYQTQNCDDYLRAINQLGSRGLIYPCSCTRSEIQAASLSAPHAGDHELRYPGICRPAASDTRQVEVLEESDEGWRVKVPEKTITWSDQLLGPQSECIHQTVGDFLIATKQGAASYQLSVVVDDSKQGVTDVVRGNDLLSSTARQLLLYELLDLEPVPSYWHLPLIVGPDGRRLAKRHGDTRISHYRETGVAPERIIGLIASWCGTDLKREMTAKKFADQLIIDRQTSDQITFTDEDRDWLER